MALSPSRYDAIVIGAWHNGLVTDDPGKLFAFRPVPGYARYRTPVGGLYLCGAAAPRGE